MSERRKLTKQQFAEEVADLCQGGESGTIFVVTSNNHQAKIVLQQGKIIAAFLRPLSGVDAINALSKEREVSFAFNNTLLMEVDAQVLPDTNALLDFLKNSPTTMSGFTAPVALAGQDQDHEPSLVRQVLIEEATEYLGPIAAPICDEYLEKYTNPLTREDILHVIGLLQRDIHDPDKAASFNTVARSRLKLR